ncbi:glucoamylase family protein [Microlunatus speluncae]|uniref:glucoamylase family protein n=1 Tax=Microlunatus speluncae TaxID=2594267 RepID=UPI001266587B|nr:glucoamylase family protein [Microlunatus speluncae]
MTTLTRRILLSGTLAATLGSMIIPGAEDEAAAEERLGLRFHRWAADTWRSLAAMTDEHTGLTADNIDGDLDPASRSGYTSPTNIGGYLWSTVVADRLGLIGGRERATRIDRTLRTLSRLVHHRPSGMFYNWYDERTGEVLTSWPGSGDRVHPFLSSVDNGWLAAALMVVAGAERDHRADAERLLRRMNFAAYYNPTPRPDLATGLLRGGFWDGEPPPDQPFVVGDYLGTGTPVNYTANHYDTTVSETRIASYIGIARRQFPASHYFGTWRTFPAGCDWDWQEQEPVGRTRRYLGIDVFEGAYRYRGSRVVPGWGGSMFEALMPDLFVPEARWAPRSWGVNHPLTVRAHRLHGLTEAGYGYWGFSPASEPGGGYREYGVEAVGLNPDGYYSDAEKTPVDLGYGACRLPGPAPEFGDGVITPHAAFLALRYEPAEAYRNLIKVADELGCYGAGGFYDAVAVRSGTLARRYLSLDQAMIMGSLGNRLADDVIRRSFCGRDVTAMIKPLIGMETFGAGLD